MQLTTMGGRETSLQIYSFLYRFPETLLKGFQFVSKCLSHGDSFSLLRRTTGALQQRLTVGPGFLLLVRFLFWSGLKLIDFQTKYLFLKFVFDLIRLFSGHAWTTPDT
jgi:hypothetical protein